MSLLNTLRQEIRTNPNVRPSLDRDEWRFTRYGMLEAAKEMTASPNSIMSSDLKEKAMESEGTDLKASVFDIGSGISVTNVRSCSIGEFDNTTQLVPITWVTLVADVSMKKSAYHNNRVSYLEDFQRKIQKVDNGFAAAVESLIYTKLNTDKSIIYNSPLASAPYSLVGNTLQVPSANIPTFWNDAKAIMAGDDLYSLPYKVLGSTSLMPSVNHYINQGGGNSTNTNYQFGDYDFRFSNHLTVTPTKSASGFIMTDGSLGILTRINVDARNNNIATRGTEWSTTFLNTFGYEVGVMHYSECTDLSGEPGLAHLDATMIEKWQFSIDVALVTPYNSNSSVYAGAIKKFDFE